MRHSFGGAKRPGPDRSLDGGTSPGSGLFIGGSTVTDRCHARFAAAARASVIRSAGSGTIARTRSSDPGSGTGFRYGTKIAEPTSRRGGCTGPTLKRTSFTL